MSGVEIFLNSLQSGRTMGPDCRRSVMYDVKFVIHRVKKELFAQVQHFTCDSSTNTSYKQQDMIRSRTLALNKSEIFVTEFILKFSYCSKLKLIKLP